MTRSLGLAVAALAGTACTKAPVASPADATVVVSDSLGIPYYGGMISPDGSRLAWARTVEGKSAIFVSAPDGSDPVQLTSGVWDRSPVWSPDGQWLAYQAESPSFDVMVVPAAGGQPRQLTTGVERDLPVGWLPDGSAVVFEHAAAGGSRMMIAPLDGGPIRSLTPDLPGARSAGLSPDGTMLAFEMLGDDGALTIWLMDYPGGEPRQLTFDGFEDPLTTTMWSPDGRHLVYTSRRTGTLDLWIADVTSGELRQLTSDIRDDYNATWSPDGQWIAFLSNRGGQVDLWVVPSAGGEAVRVTDDIAVERLPNWSPDGTTLYYHRAAEDAGLALLPVEGGETTPVLDWPGYPIEDGDLAPDGRSVVFESSRSGNPDLWLVPVAGGEATPFAASPFGSRSPRFSPDGSQVLFLSTRAGSSDIWIAPAVGGEPRRLTGGPANETTAAWSPDGERIAFSSDRDVAGTDLWVVPADGGDATRITTGNLQPEELSWSPDGTTIYFTGARPGGGRELYRIAADGGAPVPIGASANIASSRLSPDGRQVAYSSYEGGWAFIDVVPTAGGTPRRLSNRAEQIFQPWSEWSPDGSLLAVADLDITTNRDALDLQTVRVADGTWRRLTSTASRSEGPVEFTPDGRQILVVLAVESNQVRAATVGSLLATARR